MNQPVHLGIDTASHDVTVCAIRGDRRVGTQLDLGRTSEHLLREVDALLTALDADPSDLGAVACAAGPGSFTGIRIGLATTLGIAEGLDLPAVAVSNHWAQAWAAQRTGLEGAICSMLPSHAGRWSVQRFRLKDEVRADSSIESVAAPPSDASLVTSQDRCRLHLEELGLEALWVAPLADTLATLATTAPGGPSGLRWDRSTLLQPIYGAGPAVATPPRVASQRP